MRHSARTAAHGAHLLAIDVVRASSHPSTLLPFLYQTRTLQSYAAPLKPKPKPKDIRHAASKDAKDMIFRSIPVPEKYARNVAEEDASSALRKDTMTGIERTAFARLFETLVDKSRPQGSSSPKSDALDDAGRESLRLDAELDAEFGESDEHYRQSLDRILSNELSAEAPLIDRYPETLRGMATWAQMETARQRHQQREKAHGAELEEKHEGERSIQRAEMARIEHLMRSASTDVELWAVLETQLFAHVAALELDKGPAGHKLKRTKRRPGRPSKIKIPPKPSLRSGDGENGNDHETASHDDTTLTTTTLSVIYHPLLRLALHLLSPSPSAAFALLPRIKALGFSSYILGASTALYNELLALQWRVHASPTQLLSTLNEMNTAGLQPDWDTHAVLSKAVMSSHKALAGGYGDAVRLLEEGGARAEAMQRIGEWRRRIPIVMQEMALERSRRMEAEARMVLQGAIEAGVEEEDAVDEARATG